MCFSLCLFPARNPVCCFRSASHRALKMNPTNAYMPSESSRPSGRSVEFGRTYVVRPKGKHQATIVWLHGLGDNGSSVSQLLESLPLPNVKWICPTAPTRPVAVFGGFPCAAWFDVGDLSEEGPDDTEGLDGSAAHVANLLSTEPTGIKLGIGGFSMGAATALYSASCFGEGKYGNGSSYGVELRAVFGLSGWLPCSRSLKGRIAGGSALPVLLCHGNCDDVVQYKYGERSAECMRSAGFQNVIFKRYEGLGHYTIAEEIKQVCDWLVDKMSLED